MLLDQIKINKKFTNSFFLRIVAYSFFSIFFYNFMQTHSPLGIEWRPYYYERVLNAVRNIFEFPSLAILGFTSINPLEEVSKHLENNSQDIYLVQTIPYFFHSLIYKFFGSYNLLRFGSLIDFINISITGFLIAEIGIFIFKLKNFFESIFYGSALFLIFITSPWAYRMMLAPWVHVPFLLFYLLSLFLFIKNKKILGLFSLIIAGLFNWIYSLFLFLFFILIKLINSLLGNYLYKKNTYNFLPNCLNNKNGYLLYTLCCLIPVLIRGIQFKLAGLMNIYHSGSTPLYRIGIDNYDNIHHGGILAAMQFIGGNRFNLCFELPIGLSKIEEYIKIFNCSTSILSLSILSLLSIIGLISLLKNSNQSKWILMPLTWAFFLDFSLFQQSFAVHLRGNSFIFAFIFSISFLYLIKIIAGKLKIPKNLEILFNIPLIIGIIINSIRVSYITGING